MSKRNLVLKNYLLTFIILFTFIFPTLSDYFVNLDRVALWEPDDAEHYILKKTQLQNCLIKVCKFNSSADFYVKEGLFDNSIILKRTILDYHPIYTVLLLVLEKIFFDQYLAFKVLNYFSTFLLIFFSYNFYNNYFKENLNIISKIIFFFIFFIFLTYTNLIWRDAFKLNFGIFIYLIDKIINGFKDRTQARIKFYFFNFFQIFIHPAGIVCFFIINFLFFIKSLDYKAQNFFLKNYLIKNFRIYLYFMLCSLFVVFYYFNSLKYITSDISIHNVLLISFQEAIKINLTNLKSYILSYDGLFVFLIFINFFEKKKINYFIGILFLILFFHIVNPSPEKNIIQIFDFFIKFISVFLLFEIIIATKKKLFLAISFIILIIQSFYLSKNLYNFFIVRPILDNVNYTNYNYDGMSFFLDKKKIILFDGSNDYILYHHLNNGLIDRKIYYTGYSDHDVSNIFKTNEEFYIIFDLFNSTFDLSKPINKIYIKNKDGRSISKYLKNGDTINIFNHEKTEYYITIRPLSDGYIEVNNKKIYLKKNKSIKILLKQNSLNKIIVDNIQKHVEILNIKNNKNIKNNSLNMPWNKNIELIIEDKFLDKISYINFNNIRINNNCKIIEIYFDKFQAVYAKGLCE